MEKIWTSSEKKDTSVIAIMNNIIYYGNAKKEEVENIISDFKLKTSPGKLFSLPLTYIKEIRLLEHSNYLEILYRENSNDHLIINDRSRRVEIFEYLKNIKPNISYTVSELTKWQAAKKPLIALGLMIILFLWTLYLAIEISSGSRYEIIGSPGSITGIVLGLASIGVTKVILIFGSFILIAIISSLKKMKNAGEIHRLLFK